jgi:hypothetical protein
MHYLVRSMEIKSSDKVREEIRRVYDKHPKKWHVLAGRDSRGYASTIFMHEGKTWMLKETPINPYESIGTGVEIRGIDESLRPFLKHPYSFGFRPISEQYLEEILEAGITAEAVGEILRKAPVPTKKLRSPAVLGPVTMPMEPIDFVSEKQKKLDIKLGKELDKLIHRERPDFFLPYV